MSANHSQNSINRLVSVTLPDAGFTMNTIYPLQRKEAVGAPKWYEQLVLVIMAYSGTRLRFMIQLYL
jgi:hypothetical protein